LKYFGFFLKNFQLKLSTQSGFVLEKLYLKNIFQLFSLKIFINYVDTTRENIFTVIQFSNDCKSVISEQTKKSASA
jgi:hypothetical protein